MNKELLMTRAAQAYARAGRPAHAARCYRAAGAFLRSGEVALSLGDYAAAAQDYARADRAVEAAWIRVHWEGDPAAARALLGSTQQADLRVRLVLARAAIQERAAGKAGPLPPLESLADEVCGQLESQDLADHLAQEWMLALAEYAGRADLVALVYAAAVRGRRPGAKDQWRWWAQRSLGTDLVVPDPS